MYAALLTFLTRSRSTDRISFSWEPSSFLQGTRYCNHELARVAVRLTPELPQSGPESTTASPVVDDLVHVCDRNRRPTWLPPALALRRRARPSSKIPESALREVVVSLHDTPGNSATPVGHSSPDSDAALLVCMRLMRRGIGGLMNVKLLS